MKIKINGISVETIRHSGALSVSTVTDNQYIQKTYYGYNKREAIRLFRDEVNKGGR